MTIANHNEQPKISVITPSFNQAQFLERTIRSVLDQEYSNLEYIVMDGGSTDGSTQIIAKCEARLAYWQSAQDGGQYAAVQKGFERSTGEIMAYLNSDDLYFPWTLRVVGEIFARFPEVDWLTTSCISATPADSRFPLVYYQFNRSRHRFYETRGRLFHRGSFIQQEATFWRRSLWDKAGGRLDTSLKYAGDFELWSRFYEFTSPVTVQIPLAMFRIHDEQKTTLLHEYIAEAEKVISKFPRPFWLPTILLRFFNHLYRRLDLQENIMGLRSDRVAYITQEAQWKYEKRLEWRE